MFLQHGHSPSLFWNLSIGEVMDILSYCDKQKTEETKKEIILNEVLANQISEKVARIVSMDVSYTPLWGYFPNLFEPETEEDNGLELYKAQMEDYAWKHNHRKRGEKEWTE